MTKVTLRQLAEQAVDHQDGRAAVRLSDAMRARGFTYACTLAFVQRTRPIVRAAEWDALIEAGEEAEERLS